ncbi:respiratory growth induced protein 2 [Monosporozyma servazzii]
MPKNNKKNKGPKVKSITNKAGEEIKVFEDLDDFETYLKNETEDNEFDHLHCQLKYYPPFVLNEAPDKDPEKIKESVNCHSKKFVRHLHQHVEKHLLKDISGKCLEQPELKFRDKSKQSEFDRVTWLYKDQAEINNKKFGINLEVSCNNNGAMVDVDYRTAPIDDSVTMADGEDAAL